MPSDAWDHFGACVGVNSGHLVPRDLTLSNTSLRHGCVHCPGSIFTVWNDFGTIADVIAGSLSDIPSYYLGFNLDRQVTGQTSCLRSLPRNPSCLCDHLLKRAER